MEPSALVVAAPTGTGTVRVEWSDGFVDEVTSIWLRDACQCGHCRGPNGGQRRFDPAGLHPGIGVSKVEIGADGLRVEFDDGHVGHVARCRLGRRRPRPPRPRWDATHLGTLRDRASRHHGDLTAFLADLDLHGVALMTGVPAERGWVTAVAERIGFVRETNYGRSFDVVATPDPDNLANSTLALPVHTDNPYREPVPTVQLLHCIRASGAGGLTRLVDGFAAAERVAAFDRAAFDTLTRLDIPFRYCDGIVDLCARGRLIEVDHDGAVVAVRMNSRSMEPPDLPAAELDAFYAAYRVFAAELAYPEATVELMMQPGDVIALDNRRTMHGRTAYADGADRLLQGCYIDIDAVRSAVRVAEAAIR